MKLVHTSLNTAVLSDKYVFTEWIIESPKLYANYLQELFSQQNGEDGGFVLSDKEKELNLAKNMEIIVNPFQIEFITVQPSIPSLPSDQAIPVRMGPVRPYRNPCLQSP